MGLTFRWKRVYKPKIMLTAYIERIDSIESALYYVGFDVKVVLV